MITKIIMVYLMIGFIITFVGVISLNEEEKNMYVNDLHKFCVVIVTGILWLPCLIYFNSSIYFNKNKDT